MGGFLAHHLVCAATRGCQQAEEALELAYGEDVAGALREHAPNLVYEPGERELPVDWRRCRQATLLERTRTIPRSTRTWATTTRAAATARGPPHSPV